MKEDCISFGGGGGGACLAIRVTSCAELPRGRAMGQLSLLLGLLYLSLALVNLLGPFFITFLNMFFAEMLQFPLTCLAPSEDGFKAQELTVKMALKLETMSEVGIFFLSKSFANKKDNVKINTKYSMHLHGTSVFTF